MLTLTSYPTFFYVPENQSNPIVNKEPNTVVQIFTMASDSPSLQWTPFFEGGGGSLSGSNSANDIFWSSSKNPEDTSLTSLNTTTFDLRTTEYNNHHASSSSASSQSDSDIFPISNIHQLPAWNTLGRIGGKEKEDSNTHVSPGDAYSASGLSDRVGDDGFKDDLWFIPSPESGEAHGSHSLLQRKKRINFATTNSTTAMGNGMKNSSIGSPGVSLPSTLKAFKSVPNLKRRVSSGYTARLEELLSEMGWPKQDENVGIGDSTAQDSDIGNDTIQVSSSSGQTQSGNNAMTLSSAGSQSYSLTNSESGNVLNVGSTSNHVASGGGSGSGLSRALQTTNSALYQRRAESRDGLMPVPSPVTVPKRLEENAAGTEMSNDQNDDLNSALSQSSSFIFLDQGNVDDQSGNITQNMLTNLNAVAQSSLNQQKAAALVAEQQRNQNLIDQAGTMSNLTVGQATSASPITGRPDTGSSGSNITELHTPITPFVGLSLHSAPSSGTGVSNLDSLPQIPWTANFASSSIGTGGKTTNSMNDFSMLQFNKSEYLANLQNSLGLYNLPNLMNSTKSNVSNNTSNVINPTAIIDPSTFTSFSPVQPASAIGLMPSASLKSDLFTSQSAHPLTSNQHHQKLIFPPQQQKVMPVGTSAFGGLRPRAGTAMAALGGHPSPRHMRSTPNLHLAHSPSLDGSQYNVGAAVLGGEPNSVHTTPNKSIRKIASNRRLNMLNATPETPSSHLFQGSAHIPNSPVSPSKRGRNPGGMLTGSTSFGGGGTTFEFINYGIEDADELCSAVAPSGSYKVPLKGFGANDDDEDDDDFGGGGGGGSMGVEEGPDADGESDGQARRPSIASVDSEGNLFPGSPRKAASRRARSSTNRSGPRWEDPDAPPVPSLTDIENKLESQFANQEGIARQVKRRKSDASMMLAGRKKSPSMSNLRKA